MTEISIETEARTRVRSRAKFTDPDLTAKGETRAQVALERLETLWINTGTLCNIECVNCYIESSPENDRLVYMRADEAAAFFDEIAALDLGTREIGFTGGEPFMNPDMLAMAKDALARGHEVLVLTNAMQPMQRKRILAGLLELLDVYGSKLTLRVSLDHYTRELHETERGRARGRERSMASTGSPTTGSASRLPANVLERKRGSRAPRLRQTHRRSRLAPGRAGPRRSHAVSGDGRNARCSGDHDRLLEPSRG